MMILTRTQFTYMRSPNLYDREYILDHVWRVDSAMHVRKSRRSNGIKLWAQPIHLRSWVRSFMLAQFCLAPKDVI